MRIGKGSCKGTFGELVQGVLGERHFLVTLPIDGLESKATFLPSSMNSQVIGAKNHAKAIAACEKLLEMYNIHYGGWLFIDSNIPVGKGMASSSADIIAALRSVGQSLELPITEEVISIIATNIEPTDGIMYEEVVAYDYIQGELIEGLGALPAFGIIGIDGGGAVDTIQFNKQNKNYSMTEKQQLLKAYELVKAGIKNKDQSAIFKACSISARINQRILPKPYFAEVVSFAEKHDIGVVVAHSGTVLGLLFDPNQPHVNELYRGIYRQLTPILIENPLAKTYSFFGGLEKANLIQN